MTTPRPHCPHCGEGVGIMSPAQAAEMAAAIPIAPSLRADDKVYQARLDRCASCSGLREEVLCAWCGCFVRFRARPKRARCPYPAGDKWILDNAARE